LELNVIEVAFKQLLTVMST